MQELFDDQVPLLRPWITEDEVNAVADVIRSGWLCQGPKVAEFEEAVARYVGAKYAVATNACTSAVHLALRLSGIGSGDEVICPSFTCMATANSIHLAGAEPVFADIDPFTFNLDPDSVAECITPRTKAVLLVHQIGLPGDVDAFDTLTKQRGLSLLEDGACTLGATYKGKRIGGVAAPTTFSFHPRKMITTGEGGMITTNDGALAEMARCLRSTGASSSDLERHKAKGTLIQQYFENGYNYRMTDMQAAMGLVQLAKIDVMLEQRQHQARVYDEAIRNVEELEAPYVPPYATHCYSSYLVRLRPNAGINRDELLAAMAARGVSCRVGIQPLHHEPFYRERFGALSLPATEAAARETIFLPIFPGMTPAQQNQVVLALKASLTKAACGTDDRFSSSVAS